MKAAAVIVFALAVCGGARGQDIPEDSIAGVALGVPDLSILVDAAVATDLVGALSDPTSEFTVFAPTNDAFVSLLGALGLEGLADVPAEVATEILLYHVVPAVALSTDLTDGMVLPTLGGGELTVDLSDGVMIDGVGSSASVIAADVEAGSSVVHVIDTVLLPFAVGGAAPEMEPEMEPEEEELSVAALASLVPELSILVEAAVAADLVGALSDPESGFTVFAPTNDAFIAALGALGLSGLDDVPTEILADVLLYHVVAGAAFSTDLTDGMELLTLEGDPLTVDLSDGVVIEGLGSSASVIAPDNVAGESVVHIVDAVLLPFELSAAPVPEPEEDCTTIVGVASSIDDFSILVDAVVAADLVAPLNDPTSEFTVFAPTNDAFVALLGALGLESLEDVPLDLLTNVLLYHVVPAVAFSTDLSDGQVLPTLLEGAELTVDLSDGVVIDGVGSDATVVTPDVAACASVVHVIDTVLLPIVPGGDAPAAECKPNFGGCSTGEECCSGACRGPTFYWPFYRRCTAF